ncbi:MAG: hypothetical protein FP824_07830 [Euryarchaeota archaeon]|nr:hypothetical protein [Euryarchaeota archaeon]MBU4144284.1 zinc-dependent metalloprotease [Candidatus Thermoplasmatota archaeon]
MINIIKLDRKKIIAELPRILILLITFLIFFLLDNFILNFDRGWSFVIAFLTTCLISSFQKYYAFHEVKKSIKIFLVVSFAFLLFTSHIFAVIMISDRIYTNGELSFSSYPTYVNIQVEDSISVDQATILTLLAMESINKTFGYQMNLGNVSSFPNDGIVSYSNEQVSPFAKSILRGYATFTHKISMNLYFYNGTGHSMTTTYGDGNAWGTSDCASTLKLYCLSPNDDFTGNLSRMSEKIRAIIHEFGHSFGLPHNVLSPIMWTSELKDNPFNASRPEFQIRTGDGYRSSGWPGELGAYLGNDSSVGDAIQALYLHNYSEPIPLYSFSSTPLYDNKTLNFIFQTHYVVMRSQDSTNITFVTLLETNMSNPDADFQLTTYNFYCQYFHLADYSSLWLDEEIEACT